MHSRKMSWFFVLIVNFIALFWPDAIAYNIEILEYIIKDLLRLQVYITRLIQSTYLQCV